MGRSTARRGGISVMGLLGVVVLGAVLLGPHLDTQTQTRCTVTGKDRVSGYRGATDSRVYTSCGVLRVSDSIVTGHLRSADTYAAIEVGKTYDFDTEGVRIGWPLSQFPNILEARESSS